MERATERSEHGRARSWRIVGWSAGAALLLLPFLAMQFTREVAWDGADFALAGALVLATGCGWELALRVRRDRTYLGAVALALATAFVLLWANAAVGIVGSERNPLNALHHGVLAVGLVGALLARLRAPGMAAAMFATALAQAAVLLVAHYAGTQAVEPVAWVFVAAWLGSAWLFRRAARRDLARR
ncbi:hypothetical protein WG922_12330 [Ramlibacter sp. AN1015]|uniref:hypothetical protein n=1 Tax=Ramlibacter sp. AN1015 TaxID=3133428 RepID=UPI0030BDE710